MNGISNFVHRTFDLPALQTLGFAFNNISVLHSRVFGSSVGSLVSIDATENNINAIDRRIVENSETLADFRLSGNRCANRDFGSIQDNRSEVLEGLQGCHDNFENMLGG